MEKHRHHQSRHQDRRSPARPPRRGGYEPHHLRNRPCRTRQTLRHRLYQTAERTRLGTLSPVRRGYREDRTLVSRQSGMDGPHHLRRLRKVLRGDV